MLKRSIASVVSVAVLMVGPGQLTLTAAALTVTRGPVAGISVTPTIGTGLHSPVPAASLVNMTNLTPGVPTSPLMLAAPGIIATKAMPSAAEDSPLSVIRSAEVGIVEKGKASNALFDHSRAAESNLNTIAYDPGWLALDDTRNRYDRDTAQRFLAPSSGRHIPKSSIILKDGKKGTRVKLTLLGWYAVNSTMQGEPSYAEHPQIVVEVGRRGQAAWRTMAMFGDGVPQALFVEKLRSKLRKTVSRELKAAKKDGSLYRTEELATYLKVLDAKPVVEDRALAGSAIRVEFISMMAEGQYYSFINDMKGDLPGVQSSEGIVDSYGGGLFTGVKLNFASAGDAARAVAIFRGLPSTQRIRSSRAVFESLFSSAQNGEGRPSADKAVVPGTRIASVVVPGAKSWRLTKFQAATVTLGTALAVAAGLSGNLYLGAMVLLASAPGAAILGAIALHQLLHKLNAPEGLLLFGGLPGFFLGVAGTIALTAVAMMVMSPGPYAAMVLIAASLAARAGEIIYFRAGRRP